MSHLTSTSHLKDRPNEIKTTISDTLSRAFAAFLFLTDLAALELGR